MIRARKLKDGTIKFYNGNKVATDAEAKQYIKQNISLIPSGKLQDKELAKYAGRVKGGINRSKSALTDKTGKYLTKELQGKVLKKLGVNIEAMKQAKDVDSIRDLFKDEALKKRFNKLLDTGIVAWVDRAAAEAKFDEYTDKEIVINGEQYTAAKAAKLVHSLFRQARRHLEAVDTAYKLQYVGLNKVVAYLPDPSELEDYEDAAAFNEDWGNYMVVYASNPKNKKMVVYASNPKNKKKRK